LQRTGLRPADLCLELTESLFMEDVGVGKILADLKTLGIGLSIDDFGTGYSSLSRLKNLPIDAVKIDKSFVDGLGTDPHNTTLIGAIVAMAHALDLEVTAEGVETAEQMRGLEQLHVARVQGFHLARPMTAGEITQLVAESHHWHVGHDEPARPVARITDRDGPRSAGAAVRSKSATTKPAEKRRRST
jgi:EAL domain-containing protein (putative c-di-GMP-specific phosphodiesterase class I)